jgi:hypothetical protein
MNGAMATTKSGLTAVLGGFLTNSSTSTSDFNSLQLNPITISIYTNRVNPDYIRINGKSEGAYHNAPQINYFYEVFGLFWED